MPAKREVRVVDALTALLEGDLARGTLPMSRGGKISRSHYARLLEVHKTYMSNSFSSVFANFEAKIGSPGSLHDPQLPAMRAWLENEYVSGRLGIRDGKVDRKEFAERFGFKGGAFVAHYKGIRDLFHQFDARASAEGYLPKVVRERIASARLCIGAGPPLFQDGWSINRKALAVQCGFGIAFTRSGDIARMIKEYDEASLNRLREDPHVSVLHGRPYDYRPLLQFWHEEDVQAITEGFHKYASARAAGSARDFFYSVKGYFASASKFLTAQGLAGPDNRIATLGIDAWEDATRQRVQEIDAKYVQGTQDNRRLVVRRVVEHFAAIGILPHLSFRVTGKKNAKKRAGVVPSVAEAPFSSASTRDYIGFTKTVMAEASRRFEVEIDAKDTAAFATTIHHEAANEPALLAVPLPEAVLRIIARRLQAICSAAEAVLADAMEKIARGAELLAASKFDAHAFRSQLQSIGRKQGIERAQLIRRYFPLTPERREYAISNLLAFADQLCFGQFPIPSSPLNPTGFGQFLGKRYQEFESGSSLSCYLNPSRQAASSVLTLYLCASGANTEVGRELPAAFSEGSDLAGHVKITGKKARADGKPIIVHLEDDSPAVRGMRWLAENSGRIRALCPPEKSEYLFVVHAGGFGSLTQHTFRRHFKKIVSSAHGLEGLALVPRMIRPSVLLKTALENGGRIQAGAILGQHGEAVTKVYQDRYPTKLLYDDRIRTFQDRLEVLAVRYIPDAAAILGVSPQEYSVRLGELFRTGLGTFCKDPSVRSKDGGHSCATLDCPNDCVSMVIVAEVDAIATLQLWQSALKAAEGEWIRDRIERWERLWLPWQCLCNVVEEKLSRGPGIAIWERAIERRREMETVPGFIPPQPW